MKVRLQIIMGVGPELSVTGGAMERLEDDSDFPVIPWWNGSKQELAFHVRKLTLG